MELVASEPRLQPAQPRGNGRRRTPLLLRGQLGVRSDHDIAVVGAGAAGLTTAIFARRLNPGRAVFLLDSARKPGAKILVSGGSRCNVTNTTVSERDFWGGRSSIVRRVLDRFPVPETIAFFRKIGVPLHEEAGGKLFPDSNRARDVLDALLAEAARVGVTLLAGHRVTSLDRSGGRFQLTTSQGVITADAVVLATGGLSLPKTGSDGAGFTLAARLGHTLVPTTPGLVPLRLEDHERLHRELSGVSQEVELTVAREGARPIRLTGSLLWTHFGVSGPVVLNASRHWERATTEGRPVTVTVNFCPGQPFDAIDDRWRREAIDRPKATVRSTLAAMGPASFADALLHALDIDGSRRLAQFTRDERRTLVHALAAWPLAVAGSRGYNFAEVTAGGVALTEIDPSTMQSRICPGLYLVGEVLDVDGRIGGFNFQWAWSTGLVAGTALARRE